MTTGPDPMIRTDAGLRGVAGREEGVEEPIEDRERIEWRGRTFRVVLDGLDRQLTVPEALDRTVVQVDLADAEAGGGRQRVTNNLDLVVLGRHLDQTRVDVADRVVRPVMPESKACGFATGGAGHDLVTEADPEERPSVVDDRAGQGNRTGQPGGGSRAGREDDAGDVGGEHRRRVGGVRQDPDTQAAPDQAPDDV